jgi:hypothetical protein
MELAIVGFKVREKGGSHGKRAPLLCKKVFNKF